MNIVLFNIIFSISMIVFGLSAAFFLASFFAAGCTRKVKKCTQKGTATLVRVTKDGRNASQDFEIAYTCDGTDYQVMVAQAHAEGISTLTPAGTQVPIWYDPKNPKRVVIAEDRFKLKSVQAWKRTRKGTLILMLIFGAIMIFALPRTELASEMPSLSITTIGQLHEEIAVLADQTPTALTYTESDGSPETFTITVDDPAIAKEALDMILSASVNRFGCQLDMYQLQYEEYCFVFGDDTYTFGFVPKSYFCFDSQYYEMGENRLGKLRNFLHEMAAETGVLVEP